MKSRVHAAVVLLMSILLGNTGLVASGQLIIGNNIIPTEPPAPPIRTNLYYNQNWELTTPEKAVFRREASLDLRNVVFSGIYKDYTRTNHLIADGFYDQGIRKGLQTEYFENGMLKSTIEYTLNGFIIWELVTESGKVAISKGSGDFKLPFYYLRRIGHEVEMVQGTVAGKFINGIRNGNWTFHYSDGTREVEYYVNGKRILYYENPEQLRAILELYGELIIDAETVRTGKSAIDKYDNVMDALRRHGKTTSWVDHFVDSLPYSGGIEVDTGKPVELSLKSQEVEQFNFDHHSFSMLNQFFEKYGPALPKSFQRSVTFPGGIKRFLLMVELSKNLPEQTTGYDAAMMAKLNVDRNGRLKKIRGVPFILYALEEFTRAVKPFEQKLLPGIKDGKPYSSSILIPISDAPGWLNFLRELKKHF
jgi:antitoxin component YwqK of YwqJK toxin-antitoxin module